ncbi:uncharacterized protein [Dysidea avara]|uniref:uncharacterized protein isoform X3 n=1 Tax=Dysidea avara TaxID=196820 RepID=UPI0033328717
MYCCLSRLDNAVRRFALIAVCSQLLIFAVSDQVCTAPDTVGSLDHNGMIITAVRTYILTAYTVQCEGIVTTWEFCYQLTGSPSVTFNPGIWVRTGGSGGNSDYSLIQSNTVTFNPNGTSAFSCRNYTLPVTEQFTAPSESVVGLYSNLNVQLLHTTVGSGNATTYAFDGNQSRVTMAGKNNDAEFNIAIRAHIVISTSSTQVMPTTTLMPVMSITSSPIVSTSSVLVVSTNVTHVSSTIVSYSLTSFMSTTLSSSMSNIVSKNVPPTLTPIVFTSSILVVSSNSIVNISSTMTPAVSTSSIPIVSSGSTVNMSSSLTPTSLTINVSIMLTPTASTGSASIMSSNSTVSVPSAATPAVSISSTPVMLSNLTINVSSTLSPIVSSNSTVNVFSTLTPTSSTINVSMLTPVVSTNSTQIVSSSLTVSMPSAATPAVSTSSTPVVLSNLTINISSILSPVVSTSSTPIVSNLTMNMSTSFMSKSSSSVVSTNMAPVISTAITPVMFTIGPNITTGSVSDGSLPSGVVGIIAGCVVLAIVGAILLLIAILLLWYRERRKGKLIISQGTDMKNFTEQVDNIPEYAVVNKSANKTTLVIQNPILYETAEFWREDLHSSPEPIPYITPETVTSRDQPKLTCHDYHTLQNPAEYSSALHIYSNTLRDPNALSDPYCSDTLKRDDDEEVFSDPGHSEEAIYACFERRMFRTITTDHVRTSQRLGSGEFGVVHLGTWTDDSADPIQVAVKTLNSECSKSDRVKFLREAAIMGQFKDNHIVELYGVVTEKENTMIILEYMPKGDLREFLIQLKQQTPSETHDELKHDLLSFCRHVAAGLAYLSSKKFVHRDLAARNILVSSDDVCKIADFGMARDISDDTYYMSTGGKIPVMWTAPEAIFYKKYSTQSDVWSFGCVMYEIWSLGHKPFEDCDGGEYIEKITKKYRLPPPPGCPRSMYEVMIQCWNPVPSQRLPPSEISRTLQKSDRTLLPSRTTLKQRKSSEELSTKLGAPLETSSHLFTDLQNTYLYT